jgi:ribosome-associated toxin RatA of RatAB toxin-antitoxin module
MGLFPTAPSTTTGGRLRARRFLVALALLLYGPLSTAQQATTNSAEDPELTVREEQGAYGVTARFVVPYTAATALAVLTDYERIPRFMPGVTSSRVLERSGERVIVEQEAVSRMMMFSKRVHLMLQVQIEGNTIWFRDVSGRSFSCYEGSWIVTDGNGRTTIRYELNARPTFDVPEFLLKRLLRRDARQMIEQLRAEMAARQ